MVSGIVFRRLGAPAELTQARRLIAAAALVYRSPRLAGGERWSGLYNLTAADGHALTAVAATQPLSARTLEVRALAGPDLWGRLLRELADEGRARGAERMVAAAGDEAAADLLCRAGFSRRRAGWLARDL